MSAPSVAVIGGGFAGVAAAVSLRARGAAVTLFEKQSDLGGRARTDVLDDVIVDTGVQMVGSTFTRTLQLLGAHALAPIAGRDVLVREGTRYPIQFGSLTSLLGFGGLGAREKMKLGLHVLPLLARYRNALDADLERVPATLDRETARGFVARTVGARAADVLVDPALAPFYTTRGDEASLALYLTLGRYGVDCQRLVAPDGWSRALEAAASGITCAMGTTVTSIHRSSGGVELQTGDDRRWPMDGTIIATGPHEARRLLLPLLGERHDALQWLASVPTRNSWTLALGVGRPLDRRAFGILRDSTEARVVSACAVGGAKRSLPPDRDLVLAWPTPAAVERLGAEPTAAIVSAMMPEVEELLPEVRGVVSRARLYRHEGGVPLALPGFVAHRAAGRAIADGLEEPVALAGDYLTAPLVEGAVASGQRAANVLFPRLTGAPAPA